MSSDLLMKPLCRHCRSTKDLYGSNCRHMTLCMTCGKQMAEKRLGCVDCGVPVTRLIREYNVRPCSISDKNYFIGRFVSGLPQFSKKQNSENKWSLQKEGLQGRQQTDALREKYKNKPWLLEEETGQFQYSGHMEGAQSATYYLLMPQGKDFSAIPASSWYNFNKVAQYKQLTLEEAEEKMKNRRKTADGYQRWMMKAANNGPAAFGEVEKFDDKETGGGGGRGRKKSIADDDSNVSDRGEEDEEEEAGRKNRLKLKSGAGDDDEEGLRGGDLDFDDDNIEKGDDWEHEEIFTDDDEALGNDAEEREDLAPEIPPPPEIKQDEEDEDDDTNDEEGRLSKSGKELQKLLGRSNGESESDAEDDDEDDDDDSSPVLAPKKKDVLKEEPGDNSPSKPFSSGSARGTPTSSKSTKGKRKTNGDDAKATSSTPPKKVKTENEVKSSKDETGSTSKTTVAAKDSPSQSSGPSTAEPTTPVTEDEIRAVLLPNTSMTTQDLVSRFKSRLRTKEDKNKFTVALKNVGRINKTNGVNYVVLKR